MGFNNAGAAALAVRLRPRSAGCRVPLGDQPRQVQGHARRGRRSSDYLDVAAAAAPLRRLRRGQRQLAEHPGPARAAGPGGADRPGRSPWSPRPDAGRAGPPPAPLLVKVAPDLADDALEDAGRRLPRPRRGRPGRHQHHARAAGLRQRTARAAEAGGLSGPPLPPRSLEVVAPDPVRQAGDRLPVDRRRRHQQRGRRPPDARRRRRAGAALHRPDLPRARCLVRQVRRGLRPRPTLADGVPLITRTDRCGDRRRSAPSRERRSARGSTRPWRRAGRSASGSTRTPRCCAPGAWPTTPPGLERFALTVRRGAGRRGRGAQAAVGVLRAVRLARHRRPRAVLAADPRRPAR